MIRRTRQTAIHGFLVFCAFLLIPQAASAQHDAQVSFPTFSYPGRFESLRKIDFQNMVFHVWWRNGKPDFSFQFRNGKFSERGEDGFYEAEFIAVHNLDRPDSKRQRALVIFSALSGSGSSSRNHYAQVLELMEGTLRLLQEVEWNSKVDILNENYADYDARARQLTIRVAHSLDGDPNCCVSAVDIVTYSWDGEQLRERWVETELSEYGKSEGKTLSPATCCTCGGRPAEAKQTDAECLSHVAIKALAKEFVPLGPPPLAQQMRLSGELKIEILLDAAGKLECARIISGHPLLSTSALEAVRKWKFRPYSGKGTRQRACGVIRLSIWTKNGKLKTELK